MHVTIAVNLQSSYRILTFDFSFCSDKGFPVVTVARRATTKHCIGDGGTGAKSTEACDDRLVLPPP